MIKKFLFILLFTATVFGGGNIELDNGVLKIFTPDNANIMQLYRDNTQSFIDWTISSGDNTLFLTGGPVNLASLIGVGSITGSDLDITAGTGDYTSTGTLISGSVTASDLTATRVTFAGTAGLLTDDVDLTFITDTLHATNVTSTGTVTGGTVTDGTATLTGGNLTGMGNITGTDIDISAGTGTYTTSGTGTFGQIIDSGLSVSSLVWTDGSSQLTSTPTWPASGDFGYWTKAAGVVSLATVTDDLNINNGDLIVDVGNGTVNGMVFWGDTSAGNFMFGNSAVGANISGGSGNVGIGLNAFVSLGAGSSNFALGRESLKAVTSGSGNVGLGANTLRSVQTTSYNVGIGEASLDSCTGSNNVGIGSSALRFLGVGNANVCIGINAGWGTNSNSNSNTAIGGDCLRSGVGQKQNTTAIGAQAGRYATTASNCLYLGYKAGYYQTTLGNLLIVDNQSRGGVGAPTDNVNSIIYGVMAATPAAQTLALNATVTTSQGRIKNTTRYTTTQIIPVTDDQAFCNTDGGSWTATLPAGAEGQSFRIINSGSSGNQLTLAPNGAEHLLGANSNLTLDDGDTLIITYNATDGWY